ncbi:MAG: hypothetical protein LBF15_04240 [Candidatus Peribacteria bacterium]|nr:hypothetical protein [Candidatus Peribacteria bacterium]
MALRADFPLGSYSISLSSGDSYINWGGFNVEVFKNPKFTNEVSLETVGLNGELVNITDEVTALNEW